MQLTAEQQIVKRIAEEYPPVKNANGRMAIPVKRILDDHPEWRQVIFYKSNKNGAPQKLHQLTQSLRDLGVIKSAAAQAKRRKFSAAHKEKMASAQRARWARQKAATNGHAAVPQGEMTLEDAARIILKHVAVCPRCSFPLEAILRGLVTYQKLHER